MDIDKDNTTVIWPDRYTDQGDLEKQRKLQLISNTLEKQDFVLLQSLSHETKEVSTPYDRSNHSTTKNIRVAGSGEPITMAEMRHILKTKLVESLRE